MAGLLARVIVFELSFLLVFLPCYRYELGADGQAFESGSNGDSRQAKGREKFEELERDAENSECWRAALESLDLTCRELTNTKQMRLALSFANCHLESAGRRIYPCPRTMDIKECINRDRMEDLAFDIYTQFYTHANNLCYYLQSHIWQQKTESTINRLSSTSQETVDKLEQSLEYHREMDTKQQQSLKNQEAIIKQDSKIAESLAHTRLNMDKAFQEMSEKAEKQKFVLDDLLDKLTKGLSNIQWLLSLMLGEFITLETVAYFFISVFVVTCAPQFGHSRLFMYLVLIVYAVIESGIRKTVLWWTLNSTKDASLTTLHTILWYTRWICALVLICVYAWQWFADTIHFRRQMELLEDMHHMVKNMSSSSVGGSLSVTPSHHHSLTSSHHHSTPQQHYNGFSSVPVARGIQVDDSDNESVDLAQPLLNDGASQSLVLPDDINNGKQLMDFLSGVYLKTHAKPFNPSSFGSDSDTTYQQPPSITTHPPSPPTSYNGDNSSIISDTPLTRTPLSMNSSLSRSSHSRPLPSLALSRRLNDSHHHTVTNSVDKESVSSLASYSPEKEVAVEKNSSTKTKEDSTPLSSRRRRTRSRSRSRTPLLQAPVKQSVQYNLRPRGSAQSSPRYLT